MKKVNHNEIMNAIKNGVRKIEQSHKELTIYTSEKQFKEWYVFGQFDGDIEALQIANGGSQFFKDNGDYPKSNFYILYTTCADDDHVYTNMVEFEEEFHILSYTESHFLAGVDIYLNQPYFDHEKNKGDKDILVTILQFGKGE